MQVIMKMPNAFSNAAAAASKPLCAGLNPKSWGTTQECHFAGKWLHKKGFSCIGY
jgi:hypothetical protein